MKKLVWSETVLEGGRRFHGVLASPPRATGAFQGLPKPLGPADLTSTPKLDTRPAYYGDALVLAYPLPQGSRAPTATVNTGDGQRVDPKLVSDAAGPGITVPRGRPNAPSTPVVSYDQPQTIRSATAFLPGSYV